MLAAAIALLPATAKAVAITILNDLGSEIAGTFKSQIPISASRTGYDWYGGFSGSYWSGSMKFLCSPDTGAIVSLVPSFSATPNAGGTKLEGNWETGFYYDRPGSGRFIFQQFSPTPYSAGGFLVDGRFVYDSTSHVLNINGTFAVSKSGRFLALPDGGGTLQLAMIAVLPLFLFGRWCTAREGR